MFTFGDHLLYSPNLSYQTVVDQLRNCKRLKKLALFYNQLLLKKLFHFWTELILLFSIRNLNDVPTNTEVSFEQFITMQEEQILLRAI